MALLLGIDVGTSGVKALLGDHTGAVRAEATFGYPVHTPKPGWSEQDPEDWWQATIKAVRAVMAKTGKSGAPVAIGLSGQMHGSVFLDRKGGVIRRALLWNDQRTARECDEILERVGGRAKLLKLVSNPVFPGFTAPKILWLRNHEKKHFDRVAKVLLPKDYIRYRLTGEYATEMTDASGTLLLDVANRRWSRPMLSRMELDPELLPPVYESTTVSAAVHAGAARALGISVGTPVSGGGGDQAMGAVGNGIVKKGVASAMMGTSGVIFAHTDKMETEKAGRVHTFCHAVPGTWHVMSCMLSAGGMLQWFARELYDSKSRNRDTVYERIMEAAAAVVPGAEGLYCLPYLTGERTPHSDPYARGCFIGLGPRHDKSMLARAVVEGITYGMRDSLEVMRSMNIPMAEMRLSGGGSKSSFWSQLQADVYNTRCVVTNSTAGSAYGAMLVGGVGAGVWETVPEACESAIRIKKTYRPSAKRVREYDRLYAPFPHLYGALKDSFRTLAQSHE